MIFANMNNIRGDIKGIFCHNKCYRKRGDREGSVKKIAIINSDLIIRENQGFGKRLIANLLGVLASLFHVVGFVVLVLFK